jgi:hypothetical protein
VCINTVPVERARARLGALADGVELRQVTRDDVPQTIRVRFGDGMAEGVAWKLAPLRAFPDRWELSLDNDVVLWDMPPAISAWLERGDARQCLLAEDARALYGRFTPFCPAEARNAGIRGLPPQFPLLEALQRLLELVPGALDSELDEQGLQVAAVSTFCEPAVVSIEDVTICSPFPPHLRELGRCGAHFCGLNTRHYAWQLEGRYAEEWIEDQWRQHLPTVRERVAADAGTAETAVVLT